jgi:hypothetical protein
VQDALKILKGSLYLGWFIIVSRPGMSIPG